MKNKETTVDWLLGDEQASIDMLRTRHAQLFDSLMETHKKLSGYDRREEFHKALIRRDEAFKKMQSLAAYINLDSDVARFGSRTEKLKVKEFVEQTHQVKKHTSPFWALASHFVGDNFTDFAIPLVSDDQIVEILGAAYDSGELRFELAMDDSYSSLGLQRKEAERLVHQIMILKNIGRAPENVKSVRQLLERAVSEFRHNTAARSTANTNTHVDDDTSDTDAGLTNEEMMAAIFRVAERASAFLQERSVSADLISFILGKAIRVNTGDGTFTPTLQEFKILLKAVDEFQSTFRQTGTTESLTALNAASVFISAGGILRTLSTAVPYPLRGTSAYAFYAGIKDGTGEKAASGMKQRVQASSSKIPHPLRLALFDNAPHRGELVYSDVFPRDMTYGDILTMLRDFETLFMVKTDQLTERAHVRQARLVGIDVVPAPPTHFKSIARSMTDAQIKGAIESMLQLCFIRGFAKNAVRGFASANGTHSPIAAALRSQIVDAYTALAAVGTSPEPQEDIILGCCLGISAIHEVYTILHGLAHDRNIFTGMSDMQSETYWKNMDEFLTAFSAASERYGHGDASAPNFFKRLYPYMKSSCSSMAPYKLPETFLEPEYMVVKSDPSKQKSVADIIGLGNTHLSFYKQDTEAMLAKHPGFFGPVVPRDMFNHQILPFDAGDTFSSAEMYPICSCDVSWPAVSEYVLSAFWFSHKGDLVDVNNPVSDYLFRIGELRTFDSAASLAHALGIALNTQEINSLSEEIKKASEEGPSEEGSTPALYVGSVKMGASDSLVLHKLPHRDRVYFTRTFTPYVYSVVYTGGEKQRKDILPVVVDLDSLAAISVVHRSTISPAAARFLSTTSIVFDNSVKQVRAYTYADFEEQKNFGKKGQKTKDGEGPFTDKAKVDDTTSNFLHNP